MRKLLTVLGVLAISLLLPLLIVGAWLQSANFQASLTDLASDALDRPVSLSEPVQITFDPWPQLQLNGFRIANTDWGSKPYFLHIDRIEVSPRLLPLLRGEVVLDILRARDGEVWFEKHEQLGWNTPGQSDSDDDADSPDDDPFFRLRSIINAEIHNVQLAKAEDPDDGVVIERLRNEGRDGAHFTGIVDERPLELSWKSSTTPWLLHEEHRHELDVEAVYDGSPFTGTLVVDTAKSPVLITGKVHSPAFRHKSHSDSSDSNPVPDQHLFTTWLEYFEAEIDWTLDKFIVGKFDARDVKGTTTVKDAALRIYPAQGRLGDGNLRVSAVLAEPEESPSLRLTGQMDGYDLSSRLNLFEPSKSGQGMIDIRFDVHGLGDNLRLVAGTLDGTLQLVMSQARISNSTLGKLTTDLGALLDPFSEEEGSTPVRCMAIRLDIKDGVADIEQMVMDTREALIIGEGSINLKSGQMDMLLLPDDRGIELTKLQLPIRITGPINHPNADAEPSALLKRAGSDILKLLSGEGGPFDEPLRRRFSNSDEGCAATVKAYTVTVE